MRLPARLRHPWRIEADGLDQLPQGSCIVAVNRVGSFDHRLVVASLGRPATAVATPDLRSRPQQHAEWDADLASPHHPAAVLQRGEVLVVFPEGACAGDGAVHKGNAQFAALALSQQSPIVPAALVPLRPASALSPLGRPGFWPELRYRLHIGAPIEVARFADAQTPSDNLDGLVLRGLADLVMTQIAQLAQRRYLDDHTEQPRGRTRRSNAATQAAQARSERRAAQAQRLAAEAELARLLDEQDAAVVAEAIAAAQQQAERAAWADEQARDQRRQQGPGPTS